MVCPFRDVYVIFAINVGKLHEPDTFAAQTGLLFGLAFSPDGKYVLTASQDRTARLWDASTGAQLRLFPSHANTAIANAVFAPDGHSVVIGSFDGVAQQTPVLPVART